MNKILTAFFLTLSLSLSGCAFVKLKPGAEYVRVVSIAEAEQCKKIGRTTVSVLAKVAGVDRMEKKISKELNILARNSAVDLKGNAVLPIGNIKDGERTYAIYRCAK